MVIWVRGLGRFMKLGFDGHGERQLLLAKQAMQPYRHLAHDLQLGWLCCGRYVRSLFAGQPAAELCANLR